VSRALLVNMPFSNPRWPNLGPSLLKAAAARRGIPCDMAYFNFDLAEQIGLDDYFWLADHFGFVLGGERLFARHYFDSLPSDDRYYAEILRPADDGLTAGEFQHYLSLGRCVEPFLDRCLTAVDWSAYAIVGFASSFQQTMPSMCLARRLKQRHPQMKILLGGAAAEGPMGVELLRLFQEIDYVFLGEADETFPDVATQILAGDAVHLPSGVAGRTSADPTQIVVGPEPDALVDLNELAYPDFDDYFARHCRSPLAGQIDPLFFFETSRGCWWGEKHHCAFCGLNGSRMAFRAKQPERALAEIRHLIDRYGSHRACTSDNILDHRYFHTLIPMLRDAGAELRFEYELKTNLTRDQVDQLIEAGLGAAQLGIETFSTPILRLMNKGAAALHNVQALKWFSGYNVEAKWNFLYGFTGENPQEYVALAELIPSLYHLAPPGAVGRVRADRFSPYFERPADYGITNLRPNAAFAFVFPFPDECLRRLAYYFEYDYADGRNPRDYVGPLLTRLETWRQIHGTVTLRQWDRGDGTLILTDTRPDAVAFQHRLTGWEREAYRFCDTGRSLPRIVEHAASGGHAGANANRVERTLQQWVRDRIMVFLDNKYLSVALDAPASGD
jgi:ribosomal peptide maturation radical SAM protein 1